MGIGVATAGTATAAQMITGKQIKNGSITAKDLSKGLRKQLGVPGPVGRAGPSGPVGPAGPAGSVSTVVNRRFEMQGSITPPGQVGVLTGSCQSGERSLSAGYTSGGTAADFVVHRSLPMKGNNVANRWCREPGRLGHRVHPHDRAERLPQRAVRALRRAHPAARAASAASALRP